MGEKCNTCRLNDTWVNGRCTNRLCDSNLESVLYDAIILDFEGRGEAWTTDDSGDTLARAAAEVAAREIRALGR